MNLDLSSFEKALASLERAITRTQAAPNDEELLREGAVRGLVDNPEAWFEHRSQRNITSHTYNAEKANQVYQAALRFFVDAATLLKRLQARNP